MMYCLDTGLKVKNFKILSYLIFVTGMESEHTSQRYKFAEGRDSALFTTVPLLLCMMKLMGYLYSKSPNPDSGLSTFGVSS